ncbi:MAG: hypothetical protein ACQEP8_05310 [Chlamydiota bacterium]
MDKPRLFNFLKEQSPCDLLKLLEKAFNQMTIGQKHAVFGKTMENAPLIKRDPEDILEEIEKFHKNSMKGNYYAPFEINSKNFMNIPEETEEWCELAGDLLEACSQLTDSGHHSYSAKGFAMLYDLIDQVDSGEEIIFADECGSWMIPGDDDRFLFCYLKSLAATATPQEFASVACTLMKRFDFSADKMYASAIQLCSKDQKIALNETLEKSKFRGANR